MTNKIKILPNFAKMTSEEEVAFWDNAELTDYIDKKKIEKHKLKLRIKNRKAKDKLVAFRLEAEDLILLKGKALDAGVGCSTLLRMLVRKFLISSNDLLMQG